jgi:DNA-binding transcriptional LysR family regulator
VSHAITGLEQSLRVTLLERSPRGIRLNDVGEETVRHAREILRHKALIQQDADGTRRLQRGTLRIGSFGVSATRRMLPPLMDVFARRYPDVAMLVTEGTDDEVKAWIHDGTVDVGFVTLPNDALETLPIAEDDFHAVVPESHPLAAHARIQPRQLAALPFIMSNGGCETTVQDVMRGIALDVRYRIRDVDTILEMAARGVGASIMPCLALPDTLPPGVVARPLDPPRRRRVALAVRPAGDVSLPCRAFLRIAAAERDANAARAALRDQSA